MSLPRRRNVEMVMTRALILAAAVAALVSPIAVQAENSGARPQTRTQLTQRHATPRLKVPGANHAPNVTFKRGVTGSN
jgi:hypothetical protein